MRSISSLNKKGFTLIELLIIIGIIGFLSAAILVAVDPVTRLGEAKDAKRYTEVNAILNAFLQKQVDARAYYDGETSAPIVNHASNIQVIVSDDTAVTCTAATITTPTCGTKTMSTTAKDCVANLSGLAPTYIAELPIDPDGAGTDPTSATVDSPLGVKNTGYYILRTGTGGRIEIGSCWPDVAASISVKR